MNENKLELINLINLKAHEIITDEAYYNKERNKIEQLAESGKWGNKVDSQDKAHLRELKKIYTDKTTLLKTMIRNLLILYQI